MFIEDILGVTTPPFIIFGFIGMDLTGVWPYFVGVTSGRDEHLLGVGMAFIGVCPLLGTRGLDFNGVCPYFDAVTVEREGPLKDVIGFNDICSYFEGVAFRRD